MEQYTRECEMWLKSHTGENAGNSTIGKLMDISTPRCRTLVENFFGESIQLHQQYLLKDVSWDRPVFVAYSWTANYIIEALVVLLFICGITLGYRKRFFQMLLAWFACDMTLHIFLGFAINEVYIMMAGWAFIIPIAYSYLLKELPQKLQCTCRSLLVVLTIYLWIYNASQTALYLISQIC